PGIGEPAKPVLAPHLAVHGKDAVSRQTRRHLGVEEEFPSDSTCGECVKQSLVHSEMQAMGMKIIWVEHDHRHAGPPMAGLGRDSAVKGSGTAPAAPFGARWKSYHSRPESSLR